MKKIIYKSLLTFFILSFFSIIYLSLFGLETDRFNKQISNKLKNINKNLDIDLKKIKLILDPFNFKIKAKTLGSKIALKDASIQLESIESQISLRSILNKEFSLSNLEISTKSLEIKKLILFARTINRSTKLLILENFIKKGFLIADIKLNFDKDGNVKDNYSIKGLVKDAKIDFLKDHKLNKINFKFNINKNQTNLNKIELSYNDLNIIFKKLIIKNNNGEFLVNGEINNKNLLLDKKITKQFIDFGFFEVKKVNLDSKNIFSFKITKKLKLNNLKIKSKVFVNELILVNNFKLKNIFPKIKKEIIFKNQNLEVDYNNGKFDIFGNGDILLQNSNDKINFKITKKDKNLDFDTSIEIKQNLFLISFLNFKNDKKIATKINLKGYINQKQNITIDNLFLKNDLSKIKIRNISFDKNLKILSFEKAQFNYVDSENFENDFEITKTEKSYILDGKYFNANNLIEEFLNSESKKNNFPFIFDFKLDVNLNSVRLDNQFMVKNFNGTLKYKNKNFTNVNLDGVFENNGKLKLTINSFNNEKTITFFSDYAKPFIKRYKFIKGFDDGSLDFYSSSLNKKTNSTIKIYDFKLNELSVLAKLLSLASLQGIADLLTGEGIRFNELEMNFNTEGSLTTVNELYAIGPAISILMDGYVEKNKLVSLRGTLVPATTLNKVIESIPFLGDILVGSKTGEGVFGVSFKIKGPPKDLTTTVNPIKTLTPRFITRTLEKIKKN